MFAVLHFSSRHASTAMGLLGIGLLALALLDTSFMKAIDRSLFSGLACGLLGGLCVGYVIKQLAGRRARGPK